MTIVRRIAVATGVRLTSVNGHRFDVVPAGPNDLSTASVSAFGQRLRANEAGLWAAIVKGK